MNLLIVDDNLYDRKILKRHLKQLGFEGNIFEAETAEEALGTLAKQPIDLVFLDFLLPDGTGVETLKKLRTQHYALPLQPSFAMLTGSGNEEIAVEAMKEGAIDYLIKQNLTQAAVSRIIQNALKQQKMKRALEASKQQFSSLADAAPVMIWMSDRLGNAEFLNRDLQRFLGLRQDEALGHSWLERFHPEDLPLFKQNLVEAFFKQTSFDAELRLKHQEHYYYMQFSSRVRFGSEGEMAGFTGSIIDISEKKAQQRALIEEETRYKAIFTSQFDAVISTTTLGRISSANPKAKELFDYPEAELFGRNIWILFHSAMNFSQFQSKLTSVTEEGLYFPEINFIKKDNSSFFAEVTVSSLRNGSENLGYLYTIRDSTQLKERDLSLAQISRKLAQSREEERRRLARDIHDGPVQDLVGLSYSMSNLCRNPSGQDYDLAELMLRVGQWRQDITKTIKQLRAAINDLRPAGLDEFGLISALEGYFGRFKRDYAIAINFSYNLSGELADEINLTLFRSTQEILSNINKHAKASLISISLTQHTDSLSLCVEDNGKGFIVPTDLHELSSKQHFGLLGLAERIQLVKGNISIRSSPGQGTEIFISIPLSSASDLKA